MEKDMRGAAFCMYTSFYFAITCVEQAFSL